MFKEGIKDRTMKAVKGKPAIKNGKGSMGLKGLKAKKPMAKVAKGKAIKKVSGKVSALKAKSPKKLSARSKSEVAHAKRAVKLVNYKF